MTVFIIIQSITVSYESSETVSFDFAIKKKTLVFSALSKFAITLFFWIALGSAPRAVIYLSLSQSSYHFLWNKDNLINNQLCSHLLYQLQFFIVYWLIKMFLPSTINFEIVGFYFDFWKKILWMWFPTIVILKR